MLCVEEADRNAFLFSVDKQKKYNCLRVERAVCVYNNGIYFGDAELAMMGRMFSKEECHCKAGASVYNIPCDNEGNSELTGEKDNFTCIDIEVY